MRVARVSWLIAIAVVILTFAAKPLRDQVRVQRAIASQIARWREYGQSVFDAEVHIVGSWIEPYGKRAPAFAQERRADDPEMLMGAGVLAGDEVLLGRAAELAGTPVAWAAYAEVLAGRWPNYRRVGTSGADPADAAAVAAEEASIAEGGGPTRITEEDGARVLDALHSWQAADPENGLPIALEVYYLYGLHRDDECLARWEKTAQLPVLSSRSEERWRASYQVLIDMGMPEPEAIVAAQYAMIYPSYARLREAARISVYEGRVAQIEGRPEEAMRWWDATCAIGAKMQEGAENAIGFQVGVAVDGIGATPVWRWVHDGLSGVPDGPLFGGRYFYGGQHDFYVSQAGEDAAEDVRDRLVRGKVRSRITREVVSDPAWDMLAGYYRADELLVFGLFAAALGAFALVVFAAVGTWRRRVADEATALGAAWQIIIAILAVLPIAAALVILGRVPSEEGTSPGWADIRLALASLMLSLGAMIVLPLAAATFGHRPSASVATAWRGNLRRILPAILALLALGHLGLGLSAARIRAHLVAEVTSAGVAEVSWVAARAGDEWRDPAIPPDSWRAEYPPPAEPEP